MIKQILSKWKILANKTSNGISFVVLSIFFIFILTPYSFVLRQIVDVIPHQDNRTQWQDVNTDTNESINNPW